MTGVKRSLLQYSENPNAKEHNRKKFFSCNWVPSKFSLKMFIVAARLHYTEDSLSNISSH